MSLWAFVCSVHLCSLWEKEHWRLVVGSSLSHKGHFFLSQSAQSSRRFLAHTSSPQKAFGIQRTQSVSAIVDTDKGQQAAYILPIGVSRCLRPFPSGEGTGEGPSSSLNLVCSVHLCYSVREKSPHSEKERTLQIVIHKGRERRRCCLNSISLPFTP